MGQQTMYDTCRVLDVFRNGQAPLLASSLFKRLKLSGGGRWHGSLWPEGESAEVQVLGV